MEKQKWLEWRRKGIGASDAPIIMGVSPWTTPYDLLMQKVEGKEIEETFAMKRGIDLEDTARQRAEEMLGVFLFPKYCEHRKYPWMLASLDGIDLDEKIMIEIKCTSKKNHLLAKKGEVPKHYYPQLQHQLEVSGLSKMIYFSFDGEEGIILEVEKNEKYISEMIEKEKFFYEYMEKITKIRNDFLIQCP